MNLQIHPGELMKIYRNRKKISQQKLASELNEILPTLLTYQILISRIEAGIEEPSQELKDAIEQILGNEIWPKMKANI